MTYKPADKILRSLLTHAIVDLCRKQSFYSEELRIEATVCIISDRSSVVIAQITEQVGDKQGSDIDDNNDGSKRLKISGTSTTENVEKFLCKRQRSSQDCSSQQDGDGKSGQWDCDESTIQQLELATRQHFQQQQQKKMAADADSASLFPYDGHNSTRASSSPRGAEGKTLYGEEGLEMLSRLADYAPPGYERVGGQGDATEMADGRRTRTRQQPDRLGVGVDEGSMIQRAADGKYPCPYCDKTYGFRHTLKDHINTHLGRRPHACKHCPMAFSHLASLCAHIKRRHVDMMSHDHQCALCGEKFSNVQSLKQHHTWRHKSDPAVSSASVSQSVQSASSTARTPVIPSTPTRGRGRPCLNPPDNSRVQKSSDTRLVQDFSGDARFLSQHNDMGGERCDDPTRFFNCGNNTREDLARAAEGRLSDLCDRGEMWTSPGVEDCNYDDLDLSVTKMDGPWTTRSCSIDGVENGAGVGHGIGAGHTGLGMGINQSTTACNTNMTTRRQAHPSSSYTCN